MDILARVLVFTFAGLVLLIANLWFIRTVHRNFLSSDYVVAPFSVLDASGQTAADQAGEALARMMAARLRYIQAQLRDSAKARPEVSSARDLDVGTLFVGGNVEVPTGLFDPVDIKATVGGVEVGGVFSWVQNLLAREKIIRFTTFKKGDRAVITADVANFAPRVGHIWFESDNQQDEIAINAAYALIQLKQADLGDGPINRLQLDEFRRLLETVFKVNEFNHRAGLGYVVSSDFAALLPDIERQLDEIPKWPELMYLAGRIAEASGNIAKATLHYRNLQGLDTAQMSNSARSAVADSNRRLASPAIASLTQSFEAEKEERFRKAARDFSRLMGLLGDDPVIAFEPQKIEGLQALWNEDRKRMEVNPLHLETPGLPQHVALMGRFFARTYDRCVESGRINANETVGFWSEFHRSTIGFLVETQPEFKGVLNLGKHYKFHGLLVQLRDSAGPDPAKRLALELLEQYDCDWSEASIAGHMLRINSLRGFMPEKAIRDAATNTGFVPPASN